MSVPYTGHMQKKSWKLTVAKGILCPVWLPLWMPRALYRNFPESDTHLIELRTNFSATVLKLFPCLTL